MSESRTGSIALRLGSVSLRLKGFEGSSITVQKDVNELVIDVGREEVRGRWLSIQIAARLLNLSERQVRRRCRDLWLAKGLAWQTENTWEINPAADPRLVQGGTVRDEIEMPWSKVAASRKAVLDEWDKRLRNRKGSIQAATLGYLEYLRGAGQPIVKSTLYRWKWLYEKKGISGLEDGRVTTGETLAQTAARREEKPTQSSV